MLEDFKLKVFVTVVSCGSFTLAARELGISQPAVSQNIAELEKELGQALLIRSKDGVRPSEKGELLLGYARQILHWYGVINSAFAPETVFKTGQSAPETLELKLADNKTARIWSYGGDIHIELK